MSQYSNNKGRDVGKKYTSLNINQTYKGSKSENKLASGNRSHGLQSLGKVHSSRRVIAPANLPSLKSENSGNDPRVNLVPSGSQGWGTKGSSTQPLKQQNTTAVIGSSSGTTNQVQKKPEVNQEISLRPNAGVVPSGVKPAEATGKKTWGNKTSSSPPAGSTYFHREFPTLGDDANPELKAEGQNQSVEDGPSVNPRAMGHPNIMNGQKWMENMQRMPLPPNFPFNGERPIFNGNQQPFPYPAYSFIGPGGRGMPVPGYHYPFPFPAPGGKMPFDPNFMQRMPKMPFMNPPNSKSDRPSIVKDSDLKQLDEDKDEIGWDAAQEDVDYNAKLKFDESDDSDDDHENKSSESGERDKSEQKRMKGQHNWPPYPGFTPQMMNWHGMQYPPGYEAGRGNPSASGYPFPPMYYMPYGMHPNMPQQPKEKEDKAEEGDVDSSKENTTETGDKANNFAPLKEDKSDAERKAAAQEKLRKLEEKMKQRSGGETAQEKVWQSEKRRSSDGTDDLVVEDFDKEDEHVFADKTDEAFNKIESKDEAYAQNNLRTRNDSEASDSSRRSNKEKDLPPRFQRKRSGQQDAVSNEHLGEKRADSPQLRIMKRKESVESQREDQPEYTRSRENSMTLYQETAKSEHHRRHGSSSEQHEKLSRQSSSSSVHSVKEVDSKKVHDKTPVKKELKDLSESKKKNRKERRSKEGELDYGNARTTRSDNQEITQRFSDMKLSKNTKSNVKDVGSIKNQKEIPNKPTPDQPNKPSAWSKVVVGSTDDKSSSESKSLVQIQKEEEEEEIRKSKDEFKKPGAIDRQSPDENKFRSDNVQRYESSTSQNKFRDNPTENKFRSDNAQRYEPNNNESKFRSDNFSRHERKNEREPRDNHKNERPERQERGDRGERRSRYDDRKSAGRSDERNDGQRNRDENREKRVDERYRDKNKDSRDKRDTSRRENLDRKDDRNRTLRKDSEKPRDNFKRNESTSGQTKPEPKRSSEKIDRVPENSTAEWKRNKDKREENRPDSRNDRRTSRNDRDKRPYEKKNYREDDKDYRTSRRIDNDRSVDYKRGGDKPDERREKRNDWKREGADDSKKEKREPRNDWKKPSRDYAKETSSSTLLPDKKPDIDLQEKVDEKSDVVVSETMRKDSNDGNLESLKGGRDVKSSRNASSKPRDSRNERRYDYRDRDGDQGGESRESRGSSRRGRGSGKGSSSRRGSTDRFRSSGKYNNQYEDVSPGNLSDTEDKSEIREHRDEKTKEEAKRASLVKSWEKETPPRFREGRGRGRGRGRGDNSRSSFRSGRDRPRSTNYGGNTKETEVTGKAEEDGNIPPAPESTESFEDKEDKQNHEGRGTYFESRQQRSDSRRGRTARGRGSRSSRGENPPFLSNRQQIGGKEGQSKTLPAADENIGENGADHLVTGTSTLEEISMHSPPKKIKTQEKSREEKKRDFTREFDLNNIASVVCIDDIPSSDLLVPDKSIDDDGFVTVTSKKQQRELRDRIREEEKKKLKIEQKKEASKLQKERAAAAKKDAAIAKDAITPVVKASKTSVTSESASIGETLDQNNVSSTTTTTSAVVAISVIPTTVSQSAPASNAAMAAIGGWEPAQSLMRTSQLSTSIITTDQANKSSSNAINVNAWQRPLSLTTTPSDGPDPRAVGTGKPSSSQSIIKPSVVPTQPTPESASPLITPPALTPIGTSASLPSVTPRLSTTVETIEPPISATNVTESTPTTKDNDVKASASQSSLKSSSKPSNNQKKTTTDRERDKHRRAGDKQQQYNDVKKTDIKVAKRSSNKVERPPRFQNKKDGDERFSKYDDRKSIRDRDRPPRDDYKSRDSRKRTADRQRKSDSSKSNSQPSRSAKPVKETIERHPPAVTNDEPADNVFTSDTPAEAPKSILSDADKVVGSKKSSLKSQSSVGSYSAEHMVDEPVVDVKLQAESFQEPFSRVSRSERKEMSQEDENNAKQTARSVVKSLGDEDERSLETRSLPGGSPPLVVDIPEPTLSGPSSDPGKAPSPTGQKVGQVPSMELENEMNRRLFNTRKVWENPTGLSNWSSTDSPVASNVSSTSHEIIPSVMVSSPHDSSIASVSKSESGETPESPSKSTADAPVVNTPEPSTITKSAEEKSSIAPGFAATTKRPEQQVCKVKPQQQMPQADETKRLHNSTGAQLVNNHQRVSNMESIIPNSKYASFVRPDRPTSQSALYAASERPYPEQLRLQPFQSLNSQVRSVDQPGSSISQQQQQQQQQQHRDLLLSSLQVSNLYNTGLQGSQSVVAWPVVTPPNLQQQQQQQTAPQQTKTLAYQTTNFRTSLFTSPSLGSSVMMHDTFSSQRSTGSIQRPQVGLVQLPQQQHQQQPQPANQTNNIVGVIPPSAPQGRSVRREQQQHPAHQHYRSLHSDVHLPSNHMALLLSQNSNTILQQQQQQQMNAAALAQQQQINTDLTKHVNAKPFEPTTQTPPLVQSPPIVQQSVALPQQQIMSTMFRHSTSTHTIGGNHQNILNRQSQQIMQQQHLQQHHQQQPQQRQGHIQPLQQQQQQQQQHQQHNPLIASIRPRSIAQLPTHSSTQPSLPSQDRPNNIPYNQTNLSAMVVSPVSGRRQVAQPPQGHNVQHHMSIPAQALPNMQNHYLQNALSQHLQQQQQSRNLARATGIPPNRSVIPGPIQRPSQVTANHLSFPSAPPAPSQSTTTNSGGDVDFKKIQRQKMLEDTKKYFQQEQKSTPVQDKEKIEEKPSMSNPKLVISENELGEKKYNNKKAVQQSKSSSAPQDYQIRNNSRNVKRPPIVSMDAKKKHDSTTAAPSSTNAQQSRRNVPSKV